MRDDHNENTVVQRTDPLLGGVIANRFKIREKIAAGGFGAIYRAQHIASGHEVAVKVLHPQLAADPNVVARFQREGMTLQKLRAPHTVTTYEFGTAPDGTLYIVMELLKGVSLHERLRERGMLPWREALQIARAICISLTEAHALGIVHRDLKPANIHLEARGDTDYVKVLDFGIAKIKRGSSTDEQPELTNAGQMIGTIDYMSPEQILGGQADGRSDIFTLGILLFEMIAGRRPFAESTTPTSMLAALLTQTAPKLSVYAPIPPSLDSIIAKCLAREAADRFPNVDDLAEAIDRVLMTSSDDGATRTIALGLHTQKWEEEEATLMADAEYKPPQMAMRAPNTLESPAPPVPRPSSAQLPKILPSTTPAPPSRNRPATTPPPQPQPHRQHPPTPFPPYPYVQQPQTPPPQFQQPAQPYPQWQQQPQQPRNPTPAPMPAVQQPPQRMSSPVMNPSANIPVDNSGWQVPRAGGRPSQVDPSAWNAYAGNATYTPPGGDPGRQSQPFIPPVAPSFGQPDRPTPLPPTNPSLKTYDPNRDAAVGRIIWIVALVIVTLIGLAIYKFAL